MSPRHTPLANQHGFGLLAALFVVTSLALFGLLLARYTVTSQQASYEDHIWAQTLYSAEAAIKLKILRNDGGSGAVAPTVGQIPTTVVDSFAIADQPAVIRARATHQATAVSREVEARYILLPGS